MRVALVTGASRGIGAASARRLARDGLAVAINSHPDGGMVAQAKEVAEDIRSGGGVAAVFAADITDAGAVEDMFTDCEQQLGPVGALVLNAAATGRLPWDEITEDAWDRVSAVNLKGAFLCSRRAFGGVRGRDGGAVVTVSSVLAKLGAPQSLHYTTTKAGILGFTRALARELGPRGIRVNSVMPGAIQTEEELESFPDQEEARRKTLRNQMLQRRGLAEDIAGAVSFLLGPDSGFITGQTICVDGGWVLL
ncbi:SDR family NAD(P)-dependent oxidoreductase [Amycolatopsis pithecellobii]|uniref:SDR family oxidoreductase n=1 Tax=Amycolatopsis pithecellobii TaxID=664692 RepID=A0A6N7ZAF2_9PSEU|nr:SDR family NAD(P)-dependent oxidoreductase [Amycolatopsis pithecellobii]MTD58722.1 SDR family oxidoreductase [Amycolatopsis pithecellobii]